MGTMTCHGMCHGTGNISLEVLLSAGVAIRHGGGIFSVLVSCVESWRVRTWGELWWDVVVGQSFLVCTSSYGLNLKQACGGSSDTMCMIRSYGGSSSDAICAW